MAPTKVVSEACRVLLLPETAIATLPRPMATFAVVDIAGFQEIATKGAKLRVPSLTGNVGDSVTFEKVLLTADGDTANVGRPYVSGAAVKAVIKAHGRGDKIRVFKFKRRKRYQRTQGHRQGFTEIEITEL